MGFNFPQRTIIYTDGSFAAGRAGIGIHYLHGEHPDRAEPLDPGDIHTAMRAEMEAAIVAIQSTPGQIGIYTDSQALIDGAEKYFYSSSMEFDNIPNGDKWHRLSLLSRKRDITWTKVPAHGLQNKMWIT